MPSLYFNQFYIACLFSGLWSCLLTYWIIICLGKNFRNMLWSFKNLKSPFKLKADFFFLSLTFSRVTKIHLTLTLMHFYFSQDWCFVCFIEKCPSPLKYCHNLLLCNLWQKINLKVVALSWENQTLFGRSSLLLKEYFKDFQATHLLPLFSDYNTCLL